jgi:hypothetical protein
MWRPPVITLYLGEFHHDKIIVSSESSIEMFHGLVLIPVVLVQQKECDHSQHGGFGFQRSPHRALSVREFASIQYFCSTVDQHDGEYRAWSMIEASVTINIGFHKFETILSC